jgi:heat shock protein HslJ
MLNGSDPIEGTTITLSFADQVGGVAGCNEYGGDYFVVEIGIISMPGVSHTDMGCLKQGIQEQETAYLDTLQQVGAYELIDTTLVLMKANGETLLVFERGID